MTYVDGFVLAVPAAEKEAFIRHARTIDPIFLEHGATRVVECWQDNVAKGKVNDFFGAVDAREDEMVAFSFIEWPDKDTRVTQMAKIEGLMKADERMDPEKNPMPFDGKRMIWGGFEPIVELGAPRAGSYIQAFIVPVPEARKEDYRKMAADAWDMFRKYGATRVVEAYGDDVPEGKVTDFYRAAHAKPGEKIVFSYMEWPSREVCDEAAGKMQSDPDMKMPEGMEMPFDGMRMVWGGFVPVVELGEPR